MTFISFTPFSVLFIIKSGYYYQKFYVLNKDKWDHNPQFIIMSGFKSRIGYKCTRIVYDCHAQRKFIGNLEQFLIS